MALMAVVVVLLGTTVLANDDGTPNGIGEIELLEWDGVVLTTRTVPYFSEAERVLIEDWNRMNQTQAESWQRYRSGQLPDTPERSVIETEYGTITVEKTQSDASPLEPSPTEFAVEISHVETPYGIITIEKRSFGAPTGNIEETSLPSEADVQALGLSKVSDSLYATCERDGEFNFGSNQTTSNYQLNWNGGNYSGLVSCNANACTFEITTSWSAYYTYGRAYTATPGRVYGFGFNDYRCH